MQQAEQALQQRGAEAALAVYDRALAQWPVNADLHNRRGLLLQALGRRDQAQAAYERAVALLPQHAGACNNLGTLLTQQGRWAEAEAWFRRAVALRPDHGLAWHNLGYVQREQKALPDAVLSFERALALAPDKPFLRGDLLHARMRMCDWRRFDADLAAVREGLAAGRAPAEPFSLLAAVDDPALQRAAAERLVALLYPPRPGLGPIAPRTDGGGGRLRIAYVSGDFREHPVARLAAGLFEQHDRRRFELFAFSFSPETGDALQQRLRAGFDHWVDLRALSDAEAAQQARALGIDIAVDLAGFTSGCRPGLFAERLAPVQVGYLGYLGTMGAPYIDYLLAHPVLVPDVERNGYTERIAALPCYQVNDGRRAAAGRDFSRAELGLPEQGFVFACFNSGYKITPVVFGSWMRILAAVPGSVLMLYAENPWMREHLQREAAARGVAPERLVFGQRLPLAEHLARYRALDLFLDTGPYNAGTTASDALWAGLPVLTCSGRSFAGRIGESLLQALGLPELVCRSLADYEALAVALATDPARLAALRRKLREQAAGAALFDPAAFARTLEAAFEAMHARRQAGLPPADLDIKRAGAAS
jgi:predicted O-linked N-acetylglucosamine transferase (SPINDLY family)